MKFWFFFIRAELIIPEKTELLLKQNGGFILAGWHNQILSLTYHCSKYLQNKRKQRVTPLVSLSKDGEYINSTFLNFGMKSVRGSSSRGGSGGFRALLKCLKEKNVPIFTPDGPRGPKYVLQPGVVQIAALTGLPILTFYSTFSSYYVFRKSWDKHRFPKFFSKQWIVYSEPFFVPKDADEKEYAKKLEESMLKQIENLDTKIHGKVQE
ncbi:MAG: lysophospholipid acyltransferase family protein [Leptospiraceae bacterium]|nr:lysophospholipid acyltransferase family protein [Leptospiraceae bacterium]